MNDPLHKINEFNREWNDRFTIEQPRLIQRYVKSMLHFVVVFRWSIGVLDDYVAIFVAFRGARNDETVDEITTEPGINHAGNIDVTARARDCEQELVLVGDVQLMERPEQIVRSFVWVQPLDRFLSGISCTTYLRLDGLSEVLAVRNYRKTGTGSDLATTVASKVANQNIERRSEIMNTVSEDERNIVGNPLVHFQPDDKFPIGLSLGDEAYRLRLLLEERPSLISEIRQVLLGPIDFSPRAGRWIGHDPSESKG